MKNIFIIGLISLLCACAGSPAPSVAQTSSDDELDAAVRETSDYLNKNIKAGNKLVILNIQSDFPVLSEYIIDELIANTINDRIFTIVDRQQLDAIRAELNFQMSGEVDDNSAQRLGQMLGAQTIISGGITKLGDVYRLRVRALGVENAQIEGQFNRNIPSGSTVEMLVRSSPSSGSIPVASTSQARSATTQARSAQTQPATSQTTPAVSAPDTSIATPATPAAANAGTLTSIEEISTYLASVTGRASNPAPLKVAIPLGTMTSAGSGWHNLLVALNSARKFVALDLSACAMDGGTFDPRVGRDDAELNAGASFIVEIILPNAATSTAASTNDNNITFRYFSNLRKAEGNVTDIGSRTFRGHSRLAAASFPEATSIGNNAFENCGGLTSISFPGVMRIGDSAFYNCGALTTVSFPEAMRIGNWAFANCGVLTTANLPEADSIGEGAFHNCIRLTNVTLGTITPPNFNTSRSTFPGDLRDVYFQQPEGQRAGRYTRSQNSNSWSKR